MLPGISSDHSNWKPPDGLCSSRTQAQPQSNHDDKADYPDGVPRSLREGPPPLFLGEYNAMTDRASEMALPPLRSRIVSDWDDNDARLEARARQAGAASQATLALGRDVTVMVSPKDTFAITERHMRTHAGSKRYAGLKFLYCLQLQQLPDLARQSLVELADSLPNVRLVSYPLVFGDTHAMKRFVAPLVTTRYTYAIMNDVFLLDVEGGGYFEYLHEFAVSHQAKVVSVNTAESMGGKTMGGHHTADKMELVLYGPARDGYLFVHYHNEHEKQVLHANKAYSERAPFMEDHFVAVATQYLPFLYDPMVSDSKEMINLALSVKYETGEDPYALDAEEHVTYDLPHESNLQPSDVPYLLVRRCNELNPRAVAALQKKWGVMMWEDGYQHHWANKLLTGFVIDEGRLAKEGVDVQAILTAATLAMAGFTQLDIEYSLGPLPKGGDKNAQYEQFRGTFSGGIVSALERLFAIYHPGYMHAEARVPAPVDPWLYDVAVVSTREPRWEATQPLSSMRANAAAAIGSARHKALMNGELVPIVKRRNKNSTVPGGWFSFSQEHATKAYLIRFIFSQGGGKREAWEDAHKQLWSRLREVSVAELDVRSVDRMDADQGAGQREFWLWVRYEGTNGVPSMAPDEKMLESIDNAVKETFAAAGLAGCARVTLGCSQIDPCWLPSPPASAMSKADWESKGDGDRAQRVSSRLRRWAYKPLEPEFFTDTLAPQIRSAMELWSRSAMLLAADAGLKACTAEIVYS